MAERIRNAQRVVVFDTLGQYGTSLHGFTQFSQPGALRDFLRQRIGQPLKAVYQPRVGKLEDHFEVVTQLVIASGPIVYAIDEVDRFCSASVTPPGLYDLINYGRHRKVAMIVTSRRPAQIPRELTSQSAEFRVFRMTEPRDLRYLGDQMGETIAARLPSLQQFHYLLWRDDGSEPRIVGGKK